MNSKELTQIKKYQREFRKLFNKELIVDFSAMNGIVLSNSFLKEDFDKQEADLILNRLCEKHNADLNLIKENKKRLAFKHPKEIKVIAEYIKECLDRSWELKEIMPNINRDRSVAYYYRKKFKI